MRRLPKTIEQLNNLPKYYIEIDCNGVEATGYEDRLAWVCYGTIVSEGHTIAELLQNATVDLVDQDGGTAGEVEADESWMQDLIQQEYLRQISLPYKIEQIYRRAIKPLKPLSYYDTYMGKKQNLWQKLIAKIGV